MLPSAPFDYDVDVVDVGHYFLYEQQEEEEEEEGVMSDA